MNNVFDMIPPQALDIERTIIGTSMVNKTACEYMVENISNENIFYSTSNLKVFHVIRELFRKNQSIDILTVAESLKNKDWFESIGGEVYLSELTDKIGTVKSINTHIDIIKKKFKLREWIRLSGEIAQMAYEQDADEDKIESYVEKEIMGFAVKEGTKTQVIGELLPEIFEDIEKASKGKIIGVTTGFREIDKVTGGLHGSDLIILAARPSMGKSALMNALCVNCWNHSRKPALIFSLEMSKKALVKRMLSSASGVDSNSLRSGKVTKTERAKLGLSAEKIYESMIYINDDPYLNVYQIRTIALRLQRKHNFGLIAVDYLQKISDGGNMENKRLETGEKSAVLKALAKEVDVPVVCLSQLSRACETRSNKRPILSDLRESGDIEQDADIVSFIYRPFMAGEKEDPSKAEFIIAKQREGEVGTIHLHFDGATTTFRNLDKVHEEPKKEW